jgi:hypothetical protein
LYIIHKFYFVGRQEIWKTKKKKPSPSSYLMVILLQLPLILIWKNLILDPLLPPPLLLFQQHQIPTFFRIIQLLQNVQRYLKVTPLLTPFIKKIRILPPDFESSPSTFPSVPTASKPNPSIYQPKMPHSRTIYIGNSSPTTQYPAAPHTFLQPESSPNPLCSTSIMQNKHASVKSFKFSSPPKHQPQYRNTPTFNIFEPSNSPSAAPKTPCGSKTTKKRGRPVESIETPVEDTIKAFLENRARRKINLDCSTNYGFCCTLAQNLDKLPVLNQIRIQKAILELVETEFSSFDFNAS